MKVFSKIILASFILSFFLCAKNTYGAVRCETQYGGGETCVRTRELQVDKEVKKASEDLFVDNLGLSEEKFLPGEEITFKLMIKNVGDETFGTVKVEDSLPDFLELVSGDLSFEISDLTPGETEIREIKARVVSADKFPEGKTFLCVVNSVEVWSGDEHDKDTAQVCLEKKVLGAKVLPVTGPSSLPLISFSFLFLTGLFLILKEKYL